MKIRSLINPILGIATEILYALCIMFLAYLICVAISFKRWF